nr:hypothetical protein glysoja_050396 [Ipomoea batatas]
MGADADEELTSLIESVTDDESLILVSDSGIISHMASSSRTTSAIEGRESVSSWQHLRASVMNFSTHSEGYDPIRSSITENIMPEEYATTMTCERAYLPNNVFAVRNRVHSSQQLEEYYTKAVNIALVRGSASVCKYRMPFAEPSATLNLRAKVRGSLDLTVVSHGYGVLRYLPVHLLLHNIQVKLRADRNFRICNLKMRSDTIADSVTAPPIDPSMMPARAPLLRPEDEVEGGISARGP